MLITCVSFKAPFDKPKVMVYLRPWINKKILKSCWLGAGINL